MPTYNYKSGLGNVGAYQVSGRPWASSSLVVPGLSASAPLQVSFPAVSKEITIRNDGDNVIRVGFSANGISGSGKNHFTLASSGSFTSGMKVVDIFLLSDDVNAGEATIIGSLTGIPTGTITNNFSGSNGIG